MLDFGATCFGSTPPEVRLEQADGDPKARGCHPRQRPVLEFGSDSRNR
jgi:hypothetical protein